MGRLAATTGWMLAGAALFAAAFWAFVNTPESTVFTLGLSFLLALAMYAVLAVTWSGAMLGWSLGWSRATAFRALDGIPGAVLPALLIGLCWWAVGLGLDWMTAHAGEISAWFIASLNWSDVRGPLEGVRYLGEWVRQILVPFAGLAWLGHLLNGRRPFFGFSWLARALSPARLLGVTMIAGATIYAPLRFGLYWVPQGLPATWVEPAFAAAKFGAMALAGAIGASLIARVAVRD